MTLANMAKEKSSKHFADTVEDFYDEMQVEVIGNVFDNKELVGGEGE